MADDKVVNRILLVLLEHLKIWQDPPRNTVWQELKSLVVILSRDHDIDYCVREIIKISEDEIFIRDILTESDRLGEIFDWDEFPDSLRTLVVDVAADLISEFYYSNTDKHYLKSSHLCQTVLNLTKFSNESFR